MTSEGKLLLVMSIVPSEATREVVDPTACQREGHALWKGKHASLRGRSNN